MDYECINSTILDSNVMYMSLIVNKGNNAAIDANDSACNGYYKIIFYLYKYTLQEYLNMYGQVISSGEIVCEGNYYFPININSHY